MKIDKTFNMHIVFYGYENYPWIHIKKICKDLIDDNNGAVLMHHAITEAVCNKSNYAMKDHSKIEICLLVDKSIIKVKVKGITHKCNYEALVNGYRKMNIDKSWTDYVDNAFSGRGLWVILEAFDNVLFNKNTGTMYMSLNLPYKPKSNNVKDLVRKLSILSIKNRW